MTNQGSERIDPTVKLKYEWQRPYVKAVLETDRSRLHEKIEAAEKAISARMLELSQDHQGTPEERQSVEDTMRCLELLRRETE